MKITKQVVLFSLATTLFSSCDDTARNDTAQGPSKLDIAKLEEVPGMTGTTKRW